VLVQLTAIRYCTTDQFVYNTGDAAADPPTAAVLVPAPAQRSKKEQGGEQMVRVWPPE
jgi:hypothetical protein